jgi:hypothetical protein
MDERKSRKEVGNIGNEHENVTSECEKEDRNCEAIEAETDDPARCELRSVIRFLCAENTAPVDIHSQLCEVYGEKCMSL